MIRKLTFLSQLAVFKDIIPGYRVRALTDKEKSEKVSQMVARTRDWEQGLITVYQSYLRILEGELKGIENYPLPQTNLLNILSAKSDLVDVALQCLCSLATDVTHFNFRANILTCIISRLSKKSWDEVLFARFSANNH